MKQQRIGVRRVFAIILLLCASIAHAQSIVVKNAITKKMRGYKYLFSRYQPVKFTIKANGTTIEPGKEKTISISDGKLKVSYYFEFANGRKGTRIVTLSIPKDMEVATIEFDWKKKWRILIDGAEAESVEKLDA